MSWAIFTLLLAAILGLDGPWPFIAVMLAGFLIYQLG